MHIEMLDKEPEYVKLFKLNVLLAKIYNFGLMEQSNKLFNVMNKDIQDNFELLKEYLPDIFNNISKNITLDKSDINKIASSKDSDIKFKNLLPNNIDDKTALKIKNIFIKNDTESVDDQSPSIKESFLLKMKNYWFEILK